MQALARFLWILTALLFLGRHVRADTLDVYVYNFEFSVNPSGQTHSLSCSFHSFRTHKNPSILNKLFFEMLQEEFVERGG